MPEEIYCPVCGIQPVKDQAYLQRHGDYFLYHCNSCDLQYWQPRALDAAYYETSHSYAEHRLGTMPLQKWHKAFFRNFPLNGGRLLDVGCGEGAFLNAARATGFDVTGVEHNRIAARVAVEKRGLPNVFAGDLDAFIHDGGDGVRGRFDVVTCFEVIEHQAELKPFFEAIRLLLRPGGWIAGSVPNRDRFMIRREAGDYPPHHFSYWSRGALENCLSSHGFGGLSTDEHAGLEESAAYLEVQFLGTVGLKFRNFVKFLYLKDRPEAADALSAGAIRDLTGSRATGLEVLRKLRTAAFFAPTVILYPWIRSMLYFQAARNP